MMHLMGILSMFMMIVHRIDGSGSGDVLYISADWVNISGFTILRYGSHDGIKISSNHNTITGNNISSNGHGDGISLGWYYSSNIITGNNISNNWEGIYLGYSSNSNTITGNNISSNCYGINFFYSSGNTITDNSFFNDGFRVIGHYHNTVFNNTVNGKPLVYLEDESDMVLEFDAGQVILVNCDNITVHNQDLSNTTVGIELLNTDNCLIYGNTISLNNLFGIFMEHSSNSNTITGNNITSNKDCGIWLSGSRSTAITGNDISNNGDGIKFSYNSIGNIIEGNDISNNGDGIKFSHSGSNTIIKNNFIDNKIHHAFFGIYSVPCKNTWMQNYWNRPRLLPKIIFGMREIRLNSYIIPIPWIEFDWNPAQEPYDIGV